MKTIRINFRLPNGKRGVHFAATKKEAELVRHMVSALIVAKNTGITDQDALRWASRLPDKTFAKLVSWELVPARLQSKTIADVIALDEQRPNGEKTFYSHRIAGKLLIDFFGANCPLDRITQSKGHEFLQYISQVRGDKRLSISSICIYFGNAKTILNAAVSAGLMDYNPLSSVRSPSQTIDKSDWRYIDKNDVMRVIDDCPNLRTKCAIALYRFCGFRGISEFHNLSWSVEWLRWSDSNNPATLTIKSDKQINHANRLYRVVPITPYVESLLRKLYDSTEDDYIICPNNQIRWRTDFISEAFARSGIELVKPYNLRRSFCCDMMEAIGGDAKMYEDICGHSIATGLKHYQLMHAKRRIKGVDNILSYWSDDSHARGDSINSEMPPQPFPTNDSSTNSDGVATPSRTPCVRISRRKYE